MGLRVDIISLCLVLAGYFAASLQIFDKIYESSHTVIDELFHVPQGIRFCSLNFTYWDPKITTLPGLYLTSLVSVTLVLGCNQYALRLTNLVGSCVNLFLVCSILKRERKSSRYTPEIIGKAMNVALLPPLYFLSHVYYTDTLSLTFVLLLVKYYGENNVKSCFLSVFFGFCSVLMRQTNIIWVALLLGNKIMDLLVHSYISSDAKLIKKSKLKAKSLDIKKDLDYDFETLFGAVLFHIRTLFRNIFSHLSAMDYLKLFSLIKILIGFVLFVFYNGSIVVGDKTAHTATLHIPQLFYFFLFYGFFSIPYIIPNLRIVFSRMYSKMLLTFSLVLICLVIVHYNTLVHPYLLADNRHYTFYIWNKFYGKYWFFKYLMTPVYVFLGYSLYENVSSNATCGYQITFIICLFPTLCLQKMIEVRYFLIPYVLLKMKFNESPTTLAADFVINLMINIVTLSIFFTKEIYWNDFDYAQRLIW